MAKAKELVNYGELMDSIWDEMENTYLTWKRFRTCNATYAETENFYILRSYKTIVAVVNKHTGICYDFLRAVYGYTATSAQHISKFYRDFGDTTRDKYVRIDKYEQLF